MKYIFKSIAFVMKIPLSLLIWFIGNMIAALFYRDVYITLKEAFDWNLLT